MRLGRNVVIVDTAGRLQIDVELMEELRDIRRRREPHNTLLVVDAMTGQEAVNVATAFNEAVGLDGVILTKIDGDARGGAALSVKEVVGKPILFAGTGEKLDEFEAFHPDRMASRILGMGDVMTLIEKAEAAFDDEAEGARPRDPREGTLHARGLPRADAAGEEDGPDPERDRDAARACPRSCATPRSTTARSRRIEAIIQSMTPDERRKPDLINGSRRDADREGQRRQHRRREQPAEAVQAGAADDAGMPGMGARAARRARRARARGCRSATWPGIPGRSAAA